MVFLSIFKSLAIFLTCTPNSNIVTIKLNILAPIIFLLILLNNYLFQEESIPFLVGENKRNLMGEFILEH